MLDSLPFRFESATHTYTALDTGEELPHITSLLQRSGWVDDTFYTEESCERGIEVHRLTAAFDLGALDVEACDSPYRPYLLSHVKAMQIIRPEILAVEEALVHPTLRFAGRPDREVVIYGLRGVLEGKSGVPERSHQIQTALQAILVSVEAHMPADALARFAMYWKGNGTFRLLEHTDRRDFDEAYRILREYT